jgi:hypothetical protein
MHAKNYATLVNTEVGIKEMIHRVFKAIVPQTNKKNIELDLLKQHNTLSTLRFVFDGGFDRRLQKSLENNFMSENLASLFENWFITERQFNFNDDEMKGL